MSKKLNKEKVNNYCGSVTPLGVKHSCSIWKPVGWEQCSERRRYTLLEKLTLVFLDRIEQDIMNGLIYALYRCLTNSNR